MRTIRLYGILGAKFGRVYEMDVKTPAEAMRALITQLDGFERFLNNSSDNGITYAVFCGKKNIGEAQLLQEATEDIRIAPVIGGRKGGFFQTILGIALIAVAVWNPAFLALSSNMATGLFSAGIAMAAGGVIQMLSPQAGGISINEGPDNKPSYAFGGPVNSTAQGNPVPILYGTREIGGAFISGGIYAENQS